MNFRFASINDVTKINGIIPRWYLGVEFEKFLNGEVTRTTLSARQIDKSKHQF